MILLCENEISSSSNAWKTDGLLRLIRSRMSRPRSRTSASSLPLGARSRVCMSGVTCINASIARTEGLRPRNECDVGHVPSEPRPTFDGPMEAATPLRKAHVRTLGDRVVADGLVIDDECAARLVREREERGEDPAAVLVDAVEIGARVLDREQAGANADFVRAELERATREAEHALGEQTRAFGEQVARKVDEAFGAESGHVTKVLQRHFADESS